jgi:hypothetical protein
MVTVALFREIPIIKSLASTRYELHNEVTYVFKVKIALATKIFTDGLFVRTHK